MTLIARALRRVRAGVDKTAWHHRATESAPETVTLTSTAFEDGAPIPGDMPAPVWAMTSHRSFNGQVFPAMPSSSS